MTKENHLFHQISFFRSLSSVVITFLILLCISSCEPLATGFDETEDAQYFYAKTTTPVPDTFSVIRVMTWNIRFGAGRIPWFGDACGNRVILTEDEVYSSLQAIVDKINLVKPDVLLLQEVDLNSKRSGYIDQLRWIFDHTWFNYAVYGSQWKAQFIPSDGLGRMDEGNAILSRWKISNAQ
jgi:Endonuclease/Exonuclease/phosphatase family